jgi:1-acyl-sn-glycerol-3-phosphate acyltransferase
MLYQLLKTLMRITVKVFFKNITVRNSGLIPKNAPLLVLANHPSTFMDPIVLATILKRKVYFLGKGELFKGKFAKWILPKFNIIPVYRKQDNPDLMGENEKTFQKCYEHLERNGVILMFPEGISKSERKLQPIKTGAARIVLGAEARNDFSLGVQIVNIGLNYSNQHKFNQDLFVNIHPPIKVADYKDEYAKDGMEAVRLLTKDITEQLEKVVITVADEKTDALIKNIEILYKHKLTDALQESDKVKAQEFMITKSIVDCVNYYTHTQSAMVAEYNHRIENYFANLNTINMSPNDIANNSEQSSIAVKSLKALVILIIGAPIYLFGIVSNFLPFEIPGWLADKMDKTKQFRGAIGMVLGTFTFLIFYSLQIYLCWHYTHHFILTLCIAFAMPLSGLFAYWYYYKIKHLYTKWSLFMLFYKKSVLVANLISERESLISAFDKIKNEYLEIVAIREAQALTSK